MNPDQINSQLTAPFPAHEIEWRMGRTGLKGDGTPWGKCFAYITNRAIQTRLDEVAGPAGWRNEYRFETIKSPAGDQALCLCGLSLFIEGAWVTKWDGAQPSDIEAGKGALSDAMKRAAVQWGIGRYLYRLEEGWAEFDEHGEHSAKIEGKWFRWNPPSLPAWALPERKAIEARTAPEPTKAVARNGAAPSTAQATYPARQVAPAKTADDQGEDSQAWRSFSVPRFITKYAGKTLGDMATPDLMFWALNYEPRPFNGKIQPADLELKRLLTIAKDQINKAHAAPPPKRAAAEPDADYDVRY